MSQHKAHFDAVIIGASLSGNYLGFLISRLNINIAIIEEHQEIGLPFQCAGIVSQKLTTLVDVPSYILLNRVNIAKLTAPDGTHINLSGNEHPYIIDRVAFDQYFYSLIKTKRNVHYFLGEKFESFNYEYHDSERYVIVKTSKRTITTRLLIGCDGPLSRVGRSLNVKNKFLYATQVRTRANFPENEASLYFNPLWKELFGWIVPEGDSRFRIGLATTQNLAQKFRLFLKTINVSYGNKIDQQGGIIPYGKMNKCAFNNVLLLGDAACQVKATTGGGIIMLITAAKYATRAIKQCLLKNDYSGKILKKYYQEPLDQTIGKELKIHYLIRVILEHFTTDDYLKFISIIRNTELSKILSIYGDMDFPRKLVPRILKSHQVIFFLIKFLTRNPTLCLKLFFNLIIK
jgi:digeranylgeranylglycerophospholipid reductase